MSIFVLINLPLLHYYIVVTEHTYLLKLCKKTKQTNKKIRQKMNKANSMALFKIIFLYSFDYVATCQATASLLGMEMNCFIRTLYTIASLVYSIEISLISCQCYGSALTIDMYIYGALARGCHFQL